MKTVIDLVTALKTYFIGKDTSAKQAVESNIAPVETDASSSAAAYVVGNQLIVNDILYDVIEPISIGDALTVGTNIDAASKVSTAIKNVASSVDGKQDQIEVTTMPTASASNVGKVFIYIGATTSTYTSGQSYQCILDNGSYIWSKVAKAADTSYDNTSSGRTGTDVQAVIDELSDAIGDVTTNTLAANATTTSFTVPTTGDHLIDFWASDGSNYTSIDTSVAGTVTLTYTASSSARDISCRIADI